MDLIDKPKKEKKPKKDRKEYIKEYNTTYYEEHKEEILMQKNYQDKNNKTQIYEQN